MNCLVCGKDGNVKWWLSPNDFLELHGSMMSEFELDLCMCDYCNQNLDVPTMNKALYKYWLSIQPIEMKEETMIKYPTKEQYPDGYKWFAIDLDGRAFWSKKRPFYKSDEYVWNCGSDWGRACEFDVNVCPTWKETLQCKDDEEESNTPNYYTWHPKVSCKEVSQEFMSNLGQAIQYIWRSNTLQTTKGQSTEEVIADLNKALDFIKFEIERLEGSE